MAPATRNDDHLQQRLRHAGLRATGARTAVLRALAGAGGPASAHDLAQRIGPRAADRVTVYRALNAFVEHGLAHRMDPGDRVWRFALAEAPAHAHDTPPHAPHASHPHF
ncbi:MAG: transcriptional repressor, partial [Phycisphaerales bacterium]